MRKNKKLLATPPGETIKEQLEYQEMSVESFAEQMGLSSKDTENLLNGNMELDLPIAIQLENILGPPVSFWLNLEKIYRDKLAKGARKFGEKD